MAGGGFSGAAGVGHSERNPGVALPAYQLWLAVWIPGFATGALFVRFVLSIPMGVMTSFATGLAFLWLERRAAVA